jgi:6,7-dimethyl-8-ribityllumazine synthase
MRLNVPIAFCVLTVDSIEQDFECSGTKASNNVIEAAMSAIELVSLIKMLLR